MAKQVSNGIQLLCYHMLIFVKTSYQFYQRKIKLQPGQLNTKLSNSILTGKTKGFFQPLKKGKLRWLHMICRSILVNIYSNYLKFWYHSQQIHQLLVLKTWSYIKNYDQHCFLCIEINILLEDLISYLKTKPNIKNKKHSVWFRDTYVAALHIPCLHWQCGSSVSHLMRIFAWHNAITFLCRQERWSPIYCILTSSLHAHQSVSSGLLNWNYKLLGDRPVPSEAQGLEGC